MTINDFKKDELKRFVTESVLAGHVFERCRDCKRQWLDLADEESMLCGGMHVCPNCFQGFSHGFGRDLYVLYFDELGL